MNSVEYFLKEYHYQILTSVSTVKATEYVNVSGQYKKITLPDEPFILKNGDGSRKMAGIKKKIQFFFPLAYPASDYKLMSFEEYKHCRDNQIAVRYLKISDYDRLKFSSWVRAERNVRYDVYNYDDLSLHSKRCTFQKKTYKKSRHKAIV